MIKEGKYTAIEKVPEYQYLVEDNNLTFKKGDILKMCDSSIREDWYDPIKRFRFVRYVIYPIGGKPDIGLRVKATHTKSYYTVYYHTHLELDKSIMREKNINSIIYD